MKYYFIHFEFKVEQFSDEKSNGFLIYESNNNLNPPDIIKEVIEQTKQDIKDEGRELFGDIAITQFNNVK
jgi:hypothetical protein